MEQMVDKVVMTTEANTHFLTVVSELNSVEGSHQTCAKLKAHFIEVLMAFVTTGVGATAQLGYTNNATVMCNNDSIRSIKDFFAALMMSNNTTARATNKRIEQHIVMMTATQNDVALMV